MSRRTSGTSQVKPISKSKSRENKPSGGVFTMALKGTGRAKDRLIKATEKMRQTISQKYAKHSSGKRRKGSKRNRHVNIIQRWLINLFSKKIKVCDLFLGSTYCGIIKSWLFWKGFTVIEQPNSKNVLF